MPKSKHRRKPGGKAVAHPGRGKPGKPLTLDWLAPEDEPPSRVVGVEDLPLFARTDPEPSADDISDDPKPRTA